MRTRPDVRVAVIGTSASLRGLSESLRRLGWQVVRVDAIRPYPLRTPPSPLWIRRKPPADVWVVTSRVVPREFLRMNPDWRPVLQSIPEVVAVGPDTESALRGIGVRGVKVAPNAGSKSLIAAVGPVRGRTVLYLRSDRAGSSLARRLRLRGARVRDRVAYRICEGEPLPPRERRRLAAIPIWVFSSPSAVSGFHRMLGPGAFRSCRDRVQAFALGPRTAHALRQHGLRRVATSPLSTEGGFTKFLGERLGRARRAQSHQGG